jgi:hypothetical protein
VRANILVIVSSTDDPLSDIHSLQFDRLPLYISTAQRVRLNKQADAGQEREGAKDSMN